MLCPTQIDPGVALIVNVGATFTTTETVSVPVHPLLSPVTVYVVFVIGETDAVEVVTLPALALQVYVVAPDAVKITPEPLQIIVFDETAFMVGVALTFTAIVCVDMHPPPLSPVTI